jgi:hypothetical protein
MNITSRTSYFFSIFVSFSVFANVQSVIFGYKSGYSPTVGTFFSIFACCFLFWMLSKKVMFYTASEKIEPVQLLKENFTEKVALFCAFIILIFFCLWFTEQTEFLVTFFKNSLLFENTRIDTALLTFLCFLFFILLMIYKRIALIILAVCLVPVTIAIFLYIIPEFEHIYDPKILLSKNNFLDLSIIVKLINHIFVSIFTLQIFYKSIVVYQNITIDLKITYMISLPLFISLGIILFFLYPNQDNILSFLAKKSVVTYFLFTSYVLLSGCFINLLNLFFILRFITLLTTVTYKSTLMVLSALICTFIARFPNKYLLITLLNAILAIIVTIIITRISRTRTVKLQKENSLIFYLCLPFILLCFFDYIKITGTLFFDIIIISLIFCICWDTILCKKNQRC